ncbi:MAG TPA: DUF4288 domain-containing protein [Verrucomicrobiae bacterium]|jgi:hypothetical protein
MAYVPKDAEWFLAELIVEIKVTGSKRNVVHINYVIVRANSPEEAYKRANEIGKQSTNSYLNEKGNRVTKRFRGLRGLDVIYDPLDDECEIMFVEKLGVPEERFKRMVCPKRRLEVFQPIRNRPGRPDYSSGEIMALAKKELKTE